MKYKVIISLGYTGYQLLQLLHRPLVYLEHLSIGNTVGIRIEIINIAKQVSQRIPDFPVSILRPPDYLIVAPYIFLIVYTRNPQPQNIRTVLFHFILSINIIAQRFRLLHSLLIDRKAVRQNALERCSTGRTNTRQK